MNFTKHILVAGFQHETNTFAPSKADWLAFTSGASNPAYLRGEAMVAMHSTMRMPAGGFISAAVEQGWRVTGSCWAGAIPSAHVTEDAYERIAGTIVEDARAALQDDLDAIYIDFHGAAVAEHLQDPEGELLARLRAVVGPDLPIVVSLDMHANVSEEMLTLADALVAYRTYPHVDQYDTGKRAAILLERRFALGCRETTYWRRLNFLLPLNVQCTLMEPCLSIFAQLTEIEARKHAVASFTTGFPAADVAYCGPVVWAHGEAAREVVDSLFERIDEPRSQWRCGPKSDTSDLDSRHAGQSGCRWRQQHDGIAAGVAVCRGRPIFSRESCIGSHVRPRSGERRTCGRYWRYSKPLIRIRCTHL
jgi:microcystin degradation protein MlrC